MNKCPHCGQIHANTNHFCPVTGNAIDLGPRLVSVRLLEQFRVVSIIGEGPLGVVAEVEEIATGKSFATKLIHPQFSRDPESVQKLTEDVDRANTLGCEHLINVVTTGRDAGAAITIVRELLNGHSLAARIEQVGQLGLRAALPIAREILSALDALHSASILDLDISPSDVFLCPTESGTTTKLLDIGNRHIKEKLPPEFRERLSCAKYYSPEQKDPNGQPSEQSDIYTVGAIFYEMLTGTTPTVASPPVSASRKDVPESLAKAISKSLAPDPSSRFESAKAFIASIDEAIAELDAKNRPSEPPAAVATAQPQADAPAPASAAEAQASSADVAPSAPSAVQASTTEQEGTSTTADGAHASQSPVSQPPQAAPPMATPSQQPGPQPQVSAQSGVPAGTVLGMPAVDQGALAAARAMAAQQLGGPSGSTQETGAPATPQSALVSQPAASVSQPQVDGPSVAEEAQASAGSTPSSPEQASAAGVTSQVDTAATVPMPSTSESQQTGTAQVANAYPSAAPAAAAPVDVSSGTASQSQAPAATQPAAAIDPQQGAAAAQQAAVAASAVSQQSAYAAAATGQVQTSPEAAASVAQQAVATPTSTAPQPATAAAAAAPQQQPGVASVSQAPAAVAQQVAAQQAVSTPQPTTAAPQGSDSTGVEGQASVIVEMPEINKNGFKTVAIIIIIILSIAAGAGGLYYLDSESKQAEMESLAKEIQITIEVIPQNATIVVDGKEESGNPVRLKVEQNSRLHTILAKADGYETKERDIKFDESKAIFLELVEIIQPDDVAQAGASEKEEDQEAQADPTFAKGAKVPSAEQQPTLSKKAAAPKKSADNPFAKKSQRRKAQVEKAEPSSQPKQKGVKKSKKSKKGGKTKEKGGGFKTSNPFG